ncbi:MAG: YbhB/YbcL family Raf kinase inhibitor-like protein [Chloroflexota bacterium]
MKLFTLSTCLVILLTACAAPTDAPAPPATAAPTQAITPTVESATQEAAMSFELTSPAFAQGQPIPAKFSCKGADISPALAWTEPPAGTQSFALIMDDPDAPMGTWDHWVLFNIPPETRAFAEDFQPAAPIVTGKNSWGRSDYGGPCPPSGTHRYFFKLYALDSALDLSSSADKKAVLAAMQGHILAQAELMGKFTH